MARPRTKSMNEGLRSLWCFLRKKYKLRQKEAIGKIHSALQKSWEEQAVEESPRPVPSCRTIQAELSAWETERRPIREEYLPVIRNIVAQHSNEIIHSPERGRTRFALFLPHDARAFADAEERIAYVWTSSTVACDLRCPHCKHMVPSVGKHCMYCGVKFGDDESSPKTTLEDALKDLETRRMGGGSPEGSP
jgi:hypothetical protein